MFRRTKVRFNIPVSYWARGELRFIRTAAVIGLMHGGLARLRLAERTWATGKPPDFQPASPFRRIPCPAPFLPSAPRRLAESHTRPAITPSCAADVRLAADAPTSAASGSRFPAGGVRPRLPWPLPHPSCRHARFPIWHPG